MIILVAEVINEHQRFPERVATHFSASGAANGYMSRTSFMLFTLGVGIGVPAFVMGIMYSIRFFPSEGLNVPNASYWRDAKNYTRACDFLFLASLWFASGFILFHAFFARLIGEANRHSPPHLDYARANGATVALIIFVVIWVTGLLARFFKTEKS